MLPQSRSQCSPNLAINVPPIWQSMLPQSGSQCSPNLAVNFPPIWQSMLPQSGRKGQVATVWRHSSRPLTCASSPHLHLLACLPLQVQQQVQHAQQLLGPEPRRGDGEGAAALQGVGPSSPLLLALHLRTQQAMLLKLLHHLAREGEAEAAQQLARCANAGSLLLTAAI